jgi:hypothetical protein
MVLLGMLMRCECKSQADGKPLSQLPLIHNTSSATAIQNATPIHDSILKKSRIALVTLWCKDPSVAYAFQA